ncbi:MAG: hypothetical protein IPN85_03810 [Flavobacteriales bacterium]|nr:hypothetical protein [Flavobacteriales bacterium]MBK9287384.1 hypothetical protein [Flavobacteriales bacterium]
MKRILLLMSSAVLASSWTLAQSPDSSSWGSVYIGGGAFFAGSQPLYRQELALITSGSTLLAGGHVDHDYSNAGYEDATGLLDAGISFHPFRKSAGLGPELRVGFLYGGRSTLTGYLRRSTRTPYDTLTSSQTGETFYVDSVHSSTYLVEYSAERFGLSTSLVWRTKGRWSIYGGVGLAGGLLMNARTEVYHSTYDGVDDPNNNRPSDVHDGRYSGNGGTETFRNGTGWWLSLNTPLGLDFQVARRSAFWSRVHLYDELRPQLLFQGTPELGTGTNFGVQSVFGVRLKL